jgi:hypothetical protein
MTMVVQAHSLHQSTAEAEWNEQTKKLEVSLTVFINDLELALIRHSEKLIRLDKVPAEVFDEQAKLYLSQTMLARDAKGQTVPLKWVGRELDSETQKSDEPMMTLFFEFSLPEGLQDATLQNRVFTDLFADQANLLLFRQAEHKVQMLFQRGTEPQRLNAAASSKR